MKKIVIYLLCLLLILTSACSKDNGIDRENIEKSMETSSAETIEKDNTTEKEDNNKVDLGKGDKTDEKSELKIPPQFITILKGNREFLAQRGSYRWTSDGQVKKLEMPWPPIVTNIPVLISPDGDRLTVIFNGLKKKPDKACIKLFKGVLYDYKDISEAEAHGVVYTSVEENFTVGEKGIELIHEIKPFAKDLVNNDYVLEISFNWEKDIKKDDNAIYYAKVEVVSPEILSGLESTVDSFFDAAWNRDKERISSYISGRFKNSADRQIAFEKADFYNVCEASGWKYILWQHDEIKVDIINKPEFKITFIGPGLNGAFAEVVGKYDARVSKDGKSSNWNFTERYNIRLQSDQWRIERFSRIGKEEKEVNRDVTMEEKENIMGIGPFSKIGYGISMSKNEEYLGFCAINEGYEEIWIVNMKKRELKRIYELKPEDEFEGSSTKRGIRILKVDDEGRAILAVYGYMEDGPYQGNQGLWIFECSYNNDGIKSIGFIPIGNAYGRLNYYMHTARTGISDDNKFMVFNVDTKIYRMNLLDGSYKMLRDDLPTMEMMSPIAYNDDGSLMAWKNHKEDILIFDPISERERVISPSDENEVLEIVGVYGKNVILSSTHRENLQEYGDGYIAAAAERIIIYDFDKGMSKYVLPPDGLYIGYFGYDEKEGRAYYTVGTINKKHDTFAGNIKYTHSSELYQWTEEGNVKITDIDGYVKYIEKTGNMRTLWYHDENDGENRIIKKGIIIKGNNQFEKIKVGLEQNENIFLINDRQYKLVFDREKERRYCIEVDEGKDKLLFSGPFYFESRFSFEKYTIFVPHPINPSYVQSREMYLYILKNN